MSLNKTRKRSIAKSKRDLERHKRKKIENLIKEISIAMSNVSKYVNDAFKSICEALNDKK
ncbi:TPA: hypothetical protein U4W96_000173 [Streptococcus agalactiae]|uniref:hypothetical protein n=1 Tax=Streptococcus agalactiae TaxID=1311 RepID=UPI000D6ED543|nr:hypothetical protein [Streptococcus agalactiae]PWT25393.1 hypothetical protein CUZ34_01310 [Streptococcus agalactiae]HEN3143871.1 hypothetical protein [Streptococcus agalactiae]